MIDLGTLLRILFLLFGIGLILLAKPLNCPSKIAFLGGGTALAAACAGGILSINFHLPNIGVLFVGGIGIGLVITVAGGILLIARGDETFTKQN